MAARPDQHRTAFYFAAHQDDWQLFMNPPAFVDVRAGGACVFVHITAGDAGLGTGTAGRGQPLYLARENGALCAIRFMADPDWEPPAEQTASAETINGHAIHCVRYRNTAAYFLRLPDGSPAGTGYADTGLQSLQRLADGQIDTLTAVDGTTVYRGWSDLTATLRALIECERGDTPATLHLPDPDPVINPGDHSDHSMTAKAALDAAQGLSSCECALHLGYAGMNHPHNLTPQDRDRQNAVYAVTLAGVSACGHPTAWQHYDEEFIGRSYSRILTG
jgi:hypothetical protein